MATGISSIRFFSQYVNGDNFTLNTLDSSGNLIGSIGDKIRAIIQISYSQKSEATTIDEFTVDGNTIENTTGDFIADGFKVDDVIEFYDDATTSTIFTSRTITAITSNQITFDGVPVATATYNNSRLLLIGQQTGMRFKYNLIENAESKNYVSKIDGTAENIFYADGINVVPQNMTPVNGVKSWQTEEDITVQFVTQKTLVDDYEQVFEVIHEFTILPFYLDGELTNLQTNVKPALFAGFNSLKYILEADLGLDLNSVDGTRLIEGSTDNGSVGWYDENKNGQAPIYTFSSASYTDTDTASTVPGIQVNRQTTCSVIINASSSVFDANHRVQLFVANSVGIGDYQQNNNNVFENFVAERLITTVSDAPTSGTIISDYECTVLSPTSLQVDFKVEFSASQQTVVDGLNNIVFITPHDDGLTNKQTDRVAVLVPTQQNFRSADEPNLVFVTNHEYFPQESSLLDSSFTDVKGWKEDTYITKFDFDINTDEAVQIKRLEIKLGVYNPNDDSIFILDTAAYTLTPVVVQSGIQQFNIASTRGFELPTGSDRNKQELTFIGTGVNGSFNVAQYELICAMRLRYEDWIPLVTADPSFYDVNEPNDGLNMDSSRYDVAPFEVVTIMDLDVESASKQVSNYQFISPAFEVQDYDEDGNSPAWWPGVITLEDGSGNQLSVIDPDNDTVVKATFTKDASGDSITNEWGRLRMYLPNSTFRQPFELATFEQPKPNQILKPLAGEAELKITNVADVITLEGLIDKNFVSPNDNWYISARIGGTLTSPFDADALEFITNWELSTSVAMPTTQRLAVNDWYRGMKGEGTPNGNDLWTKIQAISNARIWGMVPIDDSSASSDAYVMDFMTKTTQGSYVNFVSSDINSTGVIGSSGKYFEGVFSPLDYSQNSHSNFAYVRTFDPSVNQSIMGSNVFTTTTQRIYWIIQRPTDFFFYSNAVSGSIGAAIVPENPPIGLIGFNRQNSFDVYGYANESTTTFSKSTASPSNFEIYWFARNSNGSVVAFCTSEICSIYQGLPYLTSDELEDFYTVQQRLQSNIITGGRQIGTVIPPIS